MLLIIAQPGEDYKMRRGRDLRWCVLCRMAHLRYIRDGIRMRRSAELEELDMTREKWIAPVLMFVAVGGLLGIMAANGNPLSVFTLPTLAPTILLPTSSPAPIAAPPPATLTPEPPSPVPPTLTFTATPLPSPSPNPTETFTPSPTATATDIPTPAFTPTPLLLSTLAPVSMMATLTGSTPIPTAVPMVEMSPDTINIVVLGSDRRPEWGEWHTDAIHIVSIQPYVPAVTVLSIPRDLYVYIPGFWMSRINFADVYGELYGYEGGGPALLRQTLLYNLGIPVNYYVRTDFDGFIGIIDTLGGVDIPVHCRLEDHWPYPDENGEYPIKVLEPGLHHLDGESALWYARSRMTSDVFARERRQQQVLQAIWRRARSLDLLPQVPELWEKSRSMIATDMTLEDVAMLAGVAFRLDEQNVRFRSIGYEEVIPWTTPKGGSVFLPNWEKIGPVVSEALGPMPEGRLRRTLQTVEVWNGTPNADWDQLASDRLVRQGFPVFIGEPDRRDYVQTVLIDYTTTPKGSAVPYLQEMFGISSANVISMPSAGMPVQYRLIVGADYKTCRNP
jgi:LCP family protein required for cell wall assembly